jgi:hypothetical protein
MSRGVRRRWRFGETERDGDIWLQRPSSVPIYVEYETVGSGGRITWRRLLVVTKSWLDAQTSRVRLDGDRPLWAALPTMVVVPDAPPDALRNVVDAVVQEGIFDEYSTPV